MGKWTFLSNHGHVFAYLAKHPKRTAEDISRETNLSVRGVQNILKDLHTSGYIDKQREGRCNSYIIHPELPLRSHLERNYTVGDILSALGYSKRKKSRSRTILVPSSD